MSTGGVVRCGVDTCNAASQMEHLPALLPHHPCEAMWSNLDSCEHGRWLDRKRKKGEICSDEIASTGTTENCDSGICLMDEDETVIDSVCSVQVQLELQRWTCEVCFEALYANIHPRIELSCCPHTICRTCLQQAVKHLPGRCPFSLPPAHHDLFDLDRVVACESLG